MESVLGAAQHACLKSNHHAVAFALVALVQVDVMVQVFLPELLLLLLFSYLFLEFQLGFILCALMPRKLLIGHLCVELGGNGLNAHLFVHSWLSGYWLNFL